MQKNKNRFREISEKVLVFVLGIIFFGGVFAAWDDIKTEGDILTAQDWNDLVANMGGGSAWTESGDDIYFDGGNVGIGTTVPSQQLEITGNFELQDTTYADQSGIIYKDGVPFIHNFNYGDNGTVTTVGQNIFVGENAGNLTMGSTATKIYHASYNTAIGMDVLRYNTTGFYNTANGMHALRSNTTGYSNTANGMYALRYNTTGYRNTANGMYALRSNTTGYRNTANGYASLRSNTTGYDNTANGYQSLYYNTTGYYNTANGMYAGRFIADGTTANKTTNSSVYLGYNTKASADGVTNENVFGYDATGIGSNTVTLGNDSVVTTALKGNVGIGTDDPQTELDVVGDIKASGTVCDSNGCIGDGRNFNLPVAACGANQAVTFDGINLICKDVTVPAPVTPAPVTPEPVTPEPVTPAPVTPAPVTPAPVTPAPLTCPCGGADCGAEKTESRDCCYLYYVCTLGGWMFTGDSGSCGCP